MKREEMVDQIRRILLLVCERDRLRVPESQLALPLLGAASSADTHADALARFGDNLHSLALELVWLIQMEDAGIVASPLQSGRRRLRLGSIPALRLLEEWSAPRSPLSGETLFSQVGAAVSGKASSAHATPGSRSQVGGHTARPDADPGHAPWIRPLEEPAPTRDESFYEGMHRARRLAAELELPAVKVQELVRRLYSLAVSLAPEDDLPGLVHGHGARHRLTTTPRGRLTFKLDRDRSRGQGIFTTPPDLIRELSTAVLKPVLQAGHPIPGLRFADPACGSGQFLLAAAEALVSASAASGNEDDESLRRLLQVYGVDLDPLAARTAAHNLSVWTARRLQQRHGNGRSLVGDTLDSFFGPGFPCFLGRNIQAGNALLVEASSFSPGFLWEKRFPEVFGRDNPGFDALLGNPPWVSFGLRDRNLPMEEERQFFERLFPAGTQYKLTLYPLFLELAIRLCREGGHHGFLVPDSVLSGHHFSKIRARILESCHLLELALVESAPWPGAQVGFTVFYSARKRGAELAPPKEVRNRVLHGDRSSARGARKKGGLQVELPGTAPPAKSPNGRLDSAEVWVPSSQYEGRRGAPLRVFRDNEEVRFLEAMQSAPIRFGDVIWTYSGLIGRHGQKSVQSRVQESRFLLRDKRGREVYRDDDAAGRWRPALVSGAEVTPYRIGWEGGRVFVPDEPELMGRIYKSGFDLARYRKSKVFLRQTGDRLIAALDREGFLCMNNLHLLGGTDESKIPPLIVVGLLMSAPIQRIYRIYALEGARPLAQVDLKTVESLPYPADAEGSPLGAGEPPPRSHPQCRQLFRSLSRWLREGRAHKISELVAGAVDAASAPFAEGPLRGREVLTLVFLRLLEMREEAAGEPQEDAGVSADDLQTILDQLFAQLYQLELGVPA